MSRHQITKGQMIEHAKKRLEAATSASSTITVSDVPENMIYASDTENGVYLDAQFVNAPQGILWINSSPVRPQSSMSPQI